MMDVVALGDILLEGLDITAVGSTGVVAATSA